MAEALRKQKSRSSSVDPSSNEEEQIWRDLCDGLWQLARQLERTRKKTSKINSVNTRMKERREASQEISSSTAHKYADILSKCNQALDVQKEALDGVLSKLEILIPLRKATESGADRPERRKKRKVEEKPKASLAQPKKSKGTGHPEKQLLPGQQVVAKRGELYILCNVIEWESDKGKYRVLDVDESPDDGGKIFLLPPEALIPIPDLQSSSKRPPFPKGHDILAIYPDTTCFYKGKVKVPPTSRKMSDTYGIAFEGDNGATVSVKAQMVVEDPKGC